MNPLNILVSFLVISVFVVIEPHKINARQNSDIPRPVAILLNQVSDLTRQNNCKEVVTLLESNSRSHYLLSFALGNCYLQLSKTKQAVQIYNQILSVKPHYFPAWSNLAKSYYELKMYLKAAKSFHAGYECSNPPKREFLYFSAVSFQIGRQPEKALNMFHLLMNHHPDNPPIQWKVSLVQVLLSLNKNREALPHIEEVIKKLNNPRKIKIWEETLLFQYINLGMREKATAFAEFLVSKDPLEPKWWKGLAHLKLAAKEYKDTLIILTIYSQLAALTPDEKKLLASLNQRLDIPVQSARLYEQILAEKIKPEIIQGLVQSYLKLQQPATALKWVRIGLQNFENLSLRLIKANLLVEMEAYQEASEDFQKLTVKDPNNGRFWLMLGYTALKSENHNLAISALKKAVAFEKQKQSAQNLLKQIAQII